MKDTEGTIQRETTRYGYFAMTEVHLNLGGSARLSWFPNEMSVSWVNRQGDPWYGDDRVEVELDRDVARKMVMMLQAWLELPEDDE